MGRLGGGGGKWLTNPPQSPPINGGDWGNL